LIKSVARVKIIITFALNKQQQNDKSFLF